MPEKLKRSHRTKPDVWAQLHVNTGTVSYYLDGAQEPLAVLGANDTFVILPEERHYVTSSADATFFVEFCKHKDSAVDVDPHA